VLTFWPYAARLTVGGCRPVVTMDEVMTGLGFTPPVAMIGYAVTESWLAAHPGGLPRVLGAIDQADRVMAANDEWDRLRTLTGAPDDATLAALRDRFRAGIAPRRGAADQAQASRLFAVLAETGGAELTGGATDITPGTFWQNASP